MAIGLKNAVEILPNVTNDIEFAVSESCVLDDCSVYENFTSPPRKIGPFGGPFTRGGRGPSGNPWSGPKHGKPVFHVEYVNYTMISRFKYDLSSTYVPDVTNEALRKRLCLYDQKSGREVLARKLKLSSSIKTMDLDGWVMWCNGRVDETKTTVTGATKTPLPTTMPS